MTHREIYGLIGYPVEHSLSPVMHNAAFRALGIPAEYRLFEIKPEELQDFLLKNISVKDTKGESFLSQDIVGFNITIPHKVRTLELVKNITVAQYPEVILSGAINTVKRNNGKLCYRNTDSAGFIKSLQEDLKFDTQNKNIFIFGCGGAGRAVIAGLISRGMNVKKIYIYDISKEALKSAEEHFSHFNLKDKLEFISVEQISEKIKDSGLLVNATPIGMKENDGSLIDKDLLHDGLSVYDVVYNRLTQLIQDAKNKGLNAKSGKGMLLYQGVEAFEFWTEKRAPVDIMREALEEAINKL